MPSAASLSAQSMTDVSHAARHELGLEIPRDVSLVGFDDIPAAAWPGHMLTSRMTSPENAPESRVFDGESILRDRVPKPGGSGA